MLLISMHPSFLAVVAEFPSPSLWGSRRCHDNKVGCTSIPRSSIVRFFALQDLPVRNVSDTVSFLNVTTYFMYKRKDPLASSGLRVKVSIVSTGQSAKALNFFRSTNLTLGVFQHGQATSSQPWMNGRLNAEGCSLSRSGAIPGLCPKGSRFRLGHRIHNAHESLMRFTVSLAGKASITL